MPSDDQIIAEISDALPVGVWVARAPGGEFVYANAMFREIMGMPAVEDVARGEYAEPYGIHKPDGSLYPEDELPFVRALQERTTVMVDDIVIHGEAKRHIRAYARPVFENEAITHVVIAFFDITREVEAEAQLHQTQRMEALGNLAGGVAHDFNNLLGAIKLITSSLKAREEDPRKQTQLATIDAVTESAAKLSRALLTFAGRGKNLSAPVNVRHAVAAVRKILSHALEKKIELVLDLLSEGEVLGDHARLEQLLMNLVLNARDAMPDGGKLTIRSFDQDQKVVIEVSDEGPGIPEDIRARIFEPFFTTKKGTGSSTGLGLATVYGIVESHGGTIEVRDAPEGGALFRIAFPALPPSAPKDRPTDSDEPIMGSGTILVVDDEPVLRTAAIQVLEWLGYSALGAEDGVHAVEVYRERSSEIDAVLLDMSMPRLDGRGAYLAMRDINPDVRVLLTTGYALNEQAQEILDLGVRGFIEKPWNMQQLSVALARVLE